MKLAFANRARKRPSPTGGTIREWRSADNRYIVLEVRSLYFGRYFLAARQLTSGQCPIVLTKSGKFKTRQAAEAACAQHREN